MALTKAEQRRRDATEVAVDGFDVVCRIGSVRFGDGDVSPVEAAFALIGRHNAPGFYEFPHEDGGQVQVEVVWDTPNRRTFESDLLEDR